MIVQWLKICLLSTGSLIGVYIGFGLVLSWIENLNIKYIAASLGKIGIILTGFIGTVVHEFSHFIMCMVFRHKVTEVVWFRPIKGYSDGLLGYVSHTYNPSSWYQQIGNFFIGIAPVVIGPLIILLAYYVLLPGSYVSFRDTMNSEMMKVSSDFKIGELFILWKNQFFSLLKSTFTGKNIRNPFFWIFLFMAYSISTHMSLSLADLKGAWAGLILILGIIIVFSAVMGALGLSFRRFEPVLVRYNVYMFSLLSIGVSFSIMTLCFSVVLFKLFGH